MCEGGNVRVSSKGVKNDEAMMGKEERNRTIQNQNVTGNITDRSTHSPPFGLSKHQLTLLSDPTTNGGQLT